MKNETMQEIETKQLGILSVVQCRRKLEEHEQILFDFLDKKYRDEKGHLLSGSFYVSVNGTWKQKTEEN